MVMFTFLLDNLNTPKKKKKQLKPNFPSRLSTPLKNGIKFKSSH